MNQKEIITFEKYMNSLPHYIDENMKFENVIDDKLFCPICGQINGYLLYHIERDERISRKDFESIFPTCKKAHCCKSLKNKISILLTGRRYSIEKIECKKCGRFIGKSALKKHELTCNGEIPIKSWDAKYFDERTLKIICGNFQCPKCEKLSVSIKKLKRHYWRKHTEKGQSLDAAIRNGKRKQWNKNQTKDTNKSIKQQSEKMILGYRTGKIKPNSYIDGRSSILKHGGKDFTLALKLEIKNRDRFMCAVCNKNKQSMHVHHINYNANDNHKSNLITLCNSCHAKTNHNREAWRIIFSIMMILNY